MNPAPAKHFTTAVSQADIDSLLAMLEAPAKPEPEPDLLSRFRLSACIDTILVRVELANPTKHQALKSVTGASWCESLEPDLIRSGAGSRLWLVQIEDPSNAKLQALCNALGSAYGLVADQIEWLDLAVDVRLKGLASDVKRNVVAEYEPLIRHLRDCMIPDRAWSDGWRYRGDGDDWRFPDNATGYCGDSPDCPNARFVRLYWKWFDGRDSKGEKIPLCQSAHRGRLERRFARPDLSGIGLNRIGDLDGFRFVRFGRWFKFADSRGLPLPYADHRRVIQSLGLDVRMDATLNKAFGQALSRLKF